MPVRLRQIALIGQDIDWSVNVLTSLLDTYVAYRDPGIVPMFGGMFNALLQCGDCFLEIVSPTDAGYEQNSTSARALRKNGGCCGYMAILQVDDIAASSTRLAKLGRVAMAFGAVIQADVGKGELGHKGFRYQVGDVLPKTPGTVSSVVVQWHPKDFGTLMETEEQYPPHPGAAGAWMPAGNRWQNKFGSRRSGVCEEFAAVEIAIKGSDADVRAMAAKWSEGLGVPLAADGTTVMLEGSTVRFRPVGADGRDGVVGIDLYAAAGKPKAFTECSLHGITWRLVDRTGAAGTQPLYQTLKPPGAEPIRAKM